MSYFKLSKFFLYAALFSVAIVTVSTLFPYIVGKYVFFRLTVELALIAFLVGLLKQGTEPLARLKTLFRNPLVIAVSVFTAVFLLASFFGINPAASFWSNFERGEGGFQILHLYVFFLLLGTFFTGVEDWKKFFRYATLAALLVILYGVGAILKIPGFITDPNHSRLGMFCLRFQGSLGNAAYVGTYMLFAMFYGAYLALQANKKNLRLFWFGSTALFFIALFLSQTRGAFVGLVAAVLAGLAYLFFRFREGKFKLICAALFVGIIVLGALGVRYREHIDLMPFCKGEENASRLLDISLKASTYQQRLVLWRQSILAFQERPLLGWGPENYGIAIERHYDPSMKVWFDRAHNIFFDYLVTTGILGLLSFIGIFVAYYREFFKSVGRMRPQSGKSDKNGRSVFRKRLEETLMLMVPIAYLVQGLVLFDVLPIYLNLFLFLAFAVYWTMNYELKYKYTH